MKKKNEGRIYEFERQSSKKMKRWRIEVHSKGEENDEDEEEEKRVKREDRQGYYWLKKNGARLFHVLEGKGGEWRDWRDASSFQKQRSNIKNRHHHQGREERIIMVLGWRTRDEKSREWRHERKKGKDKKRRFKEKIKRGKNKREWKIKEWTDIK